LRFCRGSLQEGRQHDVAETMQVIVDAIETAFKAKSHCQDKVKDWFFANGTEYIRADDGKGLRTLSKKNIVVGDLIVEVEAGDLHVAIDRYTSTNIDYRLPNAENIAAEKMIWFSRFPEIVCIQVQRACFDPIKKRPMKMNTKFQFPKKLFLDRYKLERKAQASKLREEHKKLTKQRNHLQQKLKEWKFLETVHALS